MKKIFFVIAVLFVAGAGFAQNAVAKGQTQFNAGVGFSSWGVPVYVGLDSGVHRNVTLGGELSFQSYQDKYNNHNYDHSVIGISGNFNYHFNNVLNIPSNWDFYAGLNLGFFIWNSPNDYEGSHTSGLGISGHIGGRYYFSNNFGVNLEFGGGNAFSGGKFGISLKL
jgi:outer membrane immunogenic protein